MGMDIVSACNHALVGQYPVRLWCWLLDIAAAYGWKPAGTILKTEIIPRETLDLNCPADDELRREFEADAATKAHFKWFAAYRDFRCHGGIFIASDNWKGGYGSNDGQFVMPNDARNLSLALIAGAG